MPDRALPEGVERRLRVALRAALDTPEESDG
jgi:hypothetical protein